MRSTKIITSFIKYDDKFLLLKRSDKVKTMRGLWGGISGIIEGDETALERAKIEIFEEVKIRESDIKLLKSTDMIRVESPQYKNHEWEIFPFLFETTNPQIRLNWENSEFKWIIPDDLSNFETVPSLDKVLAYLI